MKTLLTAKYGEATSSSGSPRWPGQLPIGRRTQSIAVEKSCLEQRPPSECGVQGVRSQREYAGDREKRAARVPCREIRGEREITQNLENENRDDQRQ